MTAEGMAAQASRGMAGSLSQGGDDQIVPIRASALESKRLIPDAQLLVYSGAPHGLTDTHKQRVNADMLRFAQSKAA